MLDWKQLVLESDEQLASRDVADVNLACAEGLPGAEKINHFECIDRLNHYARCAKHYTERRLPEFSQKAEAYDNSEAKFRIVCMIALLQHVYGVRYNPAKIPDEAVFETEDIFIHGALMGAGGTCASLPVVYAAVGRRLGYPLKLVSTRRHYFVRWEEPGQKFNIEVNAKGVAAPPDEHYREGRFQHNRWQAEAVLFLRSKTPKMELADFLNERGLHLEKYQRYREAAESLFWALALVPNNGWYAFTSLRLVGQWRRHLNGMVPPGFPQFKVNLPPRRRWPSTVAVDLEEQFIFLESLEKCLTAPHHQAWWEALRRANGHRLKNFPTALTISLKS